MKLLLFSIFFCCFLSALYAQPTAVMSEEFSVRNDNGYEILGKIKGKVLLFRDKKSSFEVAAFDEGMKTLWQKELLLHGKNIQILSAIGSKSGFYIIYKARQKRGQFAIRAYRFDENAALKDTVVVRDFGNAERSMAGVQLFRSEDKNLILLMNDETQEQNAKMLTVFRLDSLQIVWQKKFVVSSDFFENNKHHTLLTNAGKALIIFERDNEAKQIAEHRFEVITFDAFSTQQPPHILPIKTVLTADVRFAFDNLHQYLVAGGLTTDKNKERSMGYYFLSVPIADWSQITFATKPFDAALAGLVEGKEVKENKGIENLNVTTLAMRKDGGTLLVFEKIRHEERRINNPRTLQDRGATYIIFDHFYDNLLLISLHPDGNAHWKTVLNKKQYSQDDDGAFSSYFLLKNQTGLHFMFNDDIKDNNMASEYLIDANGAFDHNSLLNTKGKRLLLRFKDALQTAANEVIIPSEYGYKLSLLQLRL